jgi:hypothetical protein
VSVCFGNRDIFAIEVGEVATPGLRTVDLWLAGQRLTVMDNAAYVQSLRIYMRADAQRVRHRDVPSSPLPGRGPEEVFRLLHADETGLREQFWFMQWTEIVDNVLSYAYLDDDLVIVISFWRDDHPAPQDLGKVFATRIAPDAFVNIVEQAADLLDAGPVPG